jgi:hypothetical protein
MLLQATEFLTWKKWKVSCVSLHLLPYAYVLNATIFLPDDDMQIMDNYKKFLNMFLSAV